MKQWMSVKRWISLALLAALVCSLLPGIALGEGGQYGYVTIRKDLKERTVNFRQEPNTNDNTNYPIAKLPEYWVVELLENQPVNRSGADWYHIRANVNVDGGPAQYEKGYVMASFVTVMTAAQQEAWLKDQTSSFDPYQAPAASAAPTAVPAGSALGFVRTIMDTVNLRLTPGGKVINDENKIPLGTVMAYYSIVNNVDNYSWAEVHYDGKTGYIRSDCYAFSDAAGNLITHAPTAAPTAAPGGTVTEIGTGTYGRVTGSDVLFRRAPSSTDYWERLPAGWIMEVLGQVMEGGVMWYKVQGGTPSNPTHTYVGYIHSGFFSLSAAAPTAAPASGTESHYALITLDGINLRSTPAGAAIIALPANTVVNVITKPAGNSASDWYYVEVNGQAGYLPATALRVLLSSEVDDYSLPGVPSVIVTPTQAPAVTGSGYVKLILDQVNLRKTPGGTVLTAAEDAKLKVGTVLAYSEGPVTFRMSGKDYQWVLVTYNGITGYVRSDCYMFCDAAGNPVGAPAPSVPTAAPTVKPSSPTATQGYIKLIRGDVNVRVSPWGTSLGRLLRGTVLPYFNIKPYNNGNETWYEVYSTQLGSFGFVLSTMAQVCDSLGNPLNGNETDVPTNPQTILGYVATTASAVWLRISPSTTAETVGQVEHRGTVLPLIGTPATYGTSYMWYPVRTSAGNRAYLRGDFVYQLSEAQAEEYRKTGTFTVPTAAPATPKPQSSSFIQITADKVWVRQTPSRQAGTLGQVSTGAVFQFSQRQTVGTGANAVTWYQINYNGQPGWVHGGYARVLNTNEAGTVVGTPSPVPTAVVSTDTNLSDLALTTAGQVNIRVGASMTSKDIAQVPKAGTAIAYLGQYTAPTAQNPYTWYYVRYNGTSGWMRGDFVRVLTVTEKAQYQATGHVDEKPATYRTLSKGSTGADVILLQQKLVELGFLDASQVSGTYLASTEAAIIAFQKARGLTVDGIAGSATQHALFGTVEENSGSSVTVTLYPVEKIDWYTGGIQSIWRVNTVAVITDVYTGISFKAQRLYGDNHADCEPLTTADTAAICRIYGVTEPQDISDQEQALHSYRRRPLWVTIAGRTFCASMYGIPHNFDGDRIPDNGYNGQFCVHFTNSRTHTTNIVDPDADYNDYFGHQSAIQYAYTHSASGRK